MEKAFGNMEGLNQMNQQGLGLPWIRHSQNIGHVHEFLLSFCKLEGLPRPHGTGVET